MKKCGHCGELQEATSFNKNAAKKDGLQVNCRDCDNARSRAYHHGPHHSEHIKQITRRKERIVVDAKAWLIAYLRDHPCVDCGYSDIRALEFDHVRGEKAREISVMIGQGYTPRGLAKEIAKCEVRCANCHRIVTVERAQSYRSMSRC